jgi:hypothetical protein
MNYCMVPGEQPVLPPYLAGSRLQLLLHRPDVPLAALFPRVVKNIDLTGLDGKLAATTTYTVEDWSIMPQVGYAYPTSASSISPPDNVNRLLPFRQGEPIMPDVSPVASALYGLWARNKQPGHQPYQLFRTTDALLVGQVPPDATGDEWLETDIGRWRLTPGSLVLREQNGYGGRVLDITYAANEFGGIAGLSSDGPHTVFQLPRRFG